MTPRAVVELLKSVHVEWSSFEDWKPLPDWTLFFTSLGCAAAELSDRARPVVAVVTVPCRACAAVFCGLGVVLARSDAEIPGDAASHFEMLRKLPLGTPVIYRPNSTTKLRGQFCGIEAEADQKYVLVKGGGTLVCKIPAGVCQKVQVSQQAKSGALAMDVVFRPERLDGVLLSRLFSEAVSKAFVDSSRTDCLIVGTDVVLREEIKGTRIRVLKGGPIPAAGQLQDILRVRRMAGANTHRADVLPARGTTDPATLGAPVVIFDGAGAFLRWSVSTGLRSTLIVLDRTEPRFGDAVVEINRRGATGSLLTSLPGLLSCPQGVELLMLEEVSKRSTA